MLGGFAAELRPDQLRIAAAHLAARLKPVSAAAARARWALEDFDTLMLAAKARALTGTWVPNGAGAFWAWSALCAAQDITAAYRARTPWDPADMLAAYRARTPASDCCPSRALWALISRRRRRIRPHRPAIWWPPAPRPAATPSGRDADPRATLAPTRSARPRPPGRRDPGPRPVGADPCDPAPPRAASNRLANQH